MATPSPNAGPALRPAVAPSVGLRTKERAENFPVALRLLPRDVRGDLRAVYDVVRTVDDLGDDPNVPPDYRLVALDAFAEDLGRVWSTGAPYTPVLVALVPTVRRHALPHACFDRLVRANIMDQRVSRYETSEALLEYCALSAAPIGELVLRLFHHATPERIALSDRVCAGLQIAEHLQDVAEDRRQGRVYLPQAELAAYGVTEADLDGPLAPPGLRALVLSEADRVAAMLDAGRPLVRSLSGWARPTVAGYVAGGRAAVDGLRRADGEVLGGSPGVRRRDVLRHLAAGVVAAGRADRC